MKKRLTPKEVLYNFPLENLNSNKKSNCEECYCKDVYSKIKTAFKIDKEGYNVFLIEDYSKDKINLLIKYIEELLKESKKPDDICYVVKDDEKKPVPIFLSNGKGKLFKRTLEDIQDILLEKTFKFYNETISKEKEKLVEIIQENRNEVINSLIIISKENGFDIKVSNGGFTFIPLKDDKEMTEEEYDKLSPEEREDMMDKVNLLKNKTKKVLSELKEIEDNELDKLKGLMEIYLTNALSAKRTEFKKEFNEDKEALEYLEYVCNSILTYLTENYSINYDEDEEKINEIICKYMINVVVDNSNIEHPPVIYEEDPNLNNLLGVVEYENNNGVYTSDNSLIKSGSILRANGGCLILTVNSLLLNPQSYYYLKKFILSEKIDLSYNKGYLDLLTPNPLKPKPIKIKEKIILIGSYEFYDALYNSDEDFRKIFKIRAEYNPLVNINKEVKNMLVKAIEDICEKNNVRKLTNDGIKEVGKYLSRKAENRKKIYFDIEEISNLILLANSTISNAKKEFIDKEDIIKIAYNEEVIETEILSSYKEKRSMIEVTGSRIGQINGLSVIQAGYTVFGRPIKLTCTCYRGDGNIIDSQRDANLSGQIHNKAISILKGFMSTLNGGYSRLPVDFHLSFEQIYGVVNGDSASVAEAISMISALGKIPIKQNIAVTGSINQFGEVQPIGGVNEKIEGFFKVCKTVDTVENKGVLIPASNKEDLVLSEEVERAIEEGKFVIYTMDTIEDAIKILLDKNSFNLDKAMKAIHKEIENYSEKKETKKQSKVKLKDKDR